ncbi:hypothetical protein BGZ65_006394 [Modicella reniformis]|uniref:Uncharacterized protein n=1 Tax=Modicella reniformis TaxID=1440133 RepID=A0A9P6M8G6_9FUNG|nr:hypothetical protein BGZ65_006394 [Modicella reniformis]
MQSSPSISTTSSTADSTSTSPSTADKVLSKIEGQAMPFVGLFGVAGCGKTRTAIEMLCKKWGFYFNGSETDYGSTDLPNLVNEIKARKEYQGGNDAANTRVHILALALVLSRIMVLSRCLEIGGATFTCRQWMLLQVAGLNLGAKDFFSSLFNKIADKIHAHNIDILTMRTLIRDRFSSLRQCLQRLASGTPFQPSKILLVIDEAQILGKDDWGAFVSSQAPQGTIVKPSPDPVNQNHRRPLLSPLVRGFYQVPEETSQICVVPCGTGLSIYQMDWLMGSAPGPKNHEENLKPFRDFDGWDGVEQVRKYRALVRHSLTTEESKAIFDVYVPEASIGFLFERLRGRFRPIVSTIERMVASGHDNERNFDWKTAVLDTEKGLISTDNGFFTKGNIAFDIHRMVNRVRVDPSRYEGLQDTENQFLRGDFTVLNHEEAHLVEASVGRLKKVGQQMKTVLDEPFVLRAALNYFRRFNSGFHGILSLYFSLPQRASDLGHCWEYTVLPSLASTFNDKVLSESALIPRSPHLVPVFAFNNENLSDAVLVPYCLQASVDNDIDVSYENPVSPTVESGQDNLTWIDAVLTRRARIVGLDEHMYGISHDRISLGEFLEAHVRNDSRSSRDGTQVPAFYYPAENPTGPDIVFVLQFEDKGCCPVFIQMKLCVSLKDQDVQKAFGTVMAHAVQGHLGETKLETFCTISPKLFLGVVATYPLELPASFESLLSRPTTRNQSRNAEVKRRLWGMLLKIDANNIDRVFPENHVKALDQLKGVKRKLEEVNSDPVDEYPYKQSQTWLP